MTALDRLAERFGIEASFQDARGDIQAASPAVKRKLLAAMGFACDDEVQAAAALAESDRAAWARALPPVRVARSGAITIAVVVPAGARQVEWQLTLEDGGVRPGMAACADLPLVARTTLDGRVLERRTLALGDLGLGYHRLRVGDAEATLIVTPAQCWLPPPVANGGRIWGVAAQLYLLRSQGNWGIGDFTDLRRLVELLAPRGADVIGLNPLHAMFLDKPEHASPYSPASRLLLNVLNIDVAAVPELAGCQPAQALVASPAFATSLAVCRAAPLLDYTGVAALKLQVLSLLFGARDPDPASPRQQAFAAFRQQGGEVLQRTCVFQALREHLAEQDPSLSHWEGWPEQFRDVAGPAVVGFAEQHAERVTFRIWLQWLADTQLGEAAAAAHDAGMAVGLYRDLAVGADSGGAETWSNPRAVVRKARVGAPPDIHNPAGQDWGLPPFNPQALREEAYRSFIELVRANMRHAGGLRIDHVMALQHLYWVPEGNSPAEGAYVRYDLDDLVGILALESQRHRCLVVGEDLGTVPAGFRECMAAANILSYRVLSFEQDADGGFIPSDSYPELSVAVAGSHDLPTLRGWWEGSDITLKDGLGLYPAAGEADRQRAQRTRDRDNLVAALEREALLAPGVPVGVDDLAAAAHAFLARSRSMLAMAQIDDITDEAHPVNVPSTSDEHPNWRRRLSLDLEALAGQSRLDQTCQLFNDGRAMSRRAGTARDTA